MNVMELGGSARAAPAKSQNNDFEKSTTIDEGGNTFKDSLEKSEKTQNDVSEVSSESSTESNDVSTSETETTPEGNEKDTAPVVSVIEINYAVAFQANNSDPDQGLGHADDALQQAPNQILTIMNQETNQDGSKQVAEDHSFKGNGEAVKAGQAENNQSISEVNNFVDLENLPEVQEKTSQNDPLADMKAQYDDFNVEITDPSVSELMQNDFVPIMDEETNTITFVNLVTIAEGESFESKPQLVVNQIDFGIKEMVSTNRNSLNIQIHPEQLGKINIRLVSNADGLQIFMTSEKSSTSQLLESNLDQLHSLLQDAGVKIGGMNINLQQENMDENMFAWQENSNYNLHVSFNREEEIIPVGYGREVSTTALDYQA